MASIMKNEAQMNALAAVEAALNEISIINDMILTLSKRSNDSAKSLQLIVSGEKKPLTINVDSNHYDRITGILKAQRGKRISTVDRISKKHRIALSEKDRVLMSEEAIVAADTDSTEQTDPGKDLEADTEQDLEMCDQEQMAEETSYPEQNNVAENHSWHYQNNYRNY